MIARENITMLQQVGKWKYEIFMAFSLDYINIKPVVSAFIWDWCQTKTIGTCMVRKTTLSALRTIGRFFHQMWGALRRSENPFLIGCILFPGGLWSTFLVRQLFFFDGRGFYGEESTLHLQKISSEWRVEIHASNDLTFKRFRFWIKI